MATITASVYRGEAEKKGQELVVQWTPITENDQGGEIEVDPKGWKFVTLAAYGTFAGSISVALQGSNDGTNYVTVGSALTAAGSATVTARFRHWQILRASGASASVTVELNFVK